MTISQQRATGLETPTITGTTAPIPTITPVPDCSCEYTIKYEMTTNSEEDRNYWEQNLGKCENNWYTLGSDEITKENNKYYKFLYWCQNNRLPPGGNCNCQELGTFTYRGYGIMTEESCLGKNKVLENYCLKSGDTSQSGTIYQWQNGSCLVKDFRCHIPTPTPMPAKSCRIDVYSGAGDVIGRSSSVTLYGRGNSTGEEEIRLFAIRTDGGQIPEGKKIIIDNKEINSSDPYRNGNKYYQVGECASVNSSQCDKTLGIKLPEGNYFLFCDIPSDPGKCTGDAFFSMHEGSFPSAGWNHCSSANEDRVSFTVHPCSDCDISGDNCYNNLDWDCSKNNPPSSCNKMDFNEDGYFESSACAVYCSCSNLTPTISPCPLKSQGDANCDSAINLSDFFLWRSEFLRIITDHPITACTISYSNFDTGCVLLPLKSDFNNDGKIDLKDFFIWRKGFLNGL